MDRGERERKGGRGVCGDEWMDGWVYYRPPPHDHAFDSLRPPSTHRNNKRGPLYHIVFASQARIAPHTTHSDSMFPTSSLCCRRVALNSYPLNPPLSWTVLSPRARLTVETPESESSPSAPNTYTFTPRGILCSHPLKHSPFPIPSRTHTHRCRCDCAEDTPTRCCCSSLCFFFAIVAHLRPRIIVRLPFTFARHTSPESPLTSPSLHVALYP